MGEISFTVDPHAIDKGRLQGLIADLKSRPNSQEFLSVPKDKTITVTDNPKSPVLSKANQEYLAKTLTNGYAQNKPGLTPPQSTLHRCPPLESQRSMFLSTRSYTML